MKGRVDLTISRMKGVFLHQIDYLRMKREIIISTLNPLNFSKRILLWNRQIQ